MVKQAGPSRREVSNGIGAGGLGARLETKRDEGSGDGYTVELVVTDANGNTASASEDGS